MTTRKIIVPWGMTKSQVEETLARLKTEALVRSNRAGRPVKVPTDFELVYATRKTADPLYPQVTQANKIVMAKTREAQVGGRWLRSWRIPGYAY